MQSKVKQVKLLHKDSANNNSNNTDNNNNNNTNNGNQTTANNNKSETKPRDVNNNASDNDADGNDNEFKDDDARDEEPPLKRRRLMTSGNSEQGDDDQSNNVVSKDNDNDDHDWTRMMKDYFLKYFDFSTMNDSFFAKYIYHCQPPILTIDEKLVSLERVEQKSDNAFDRLPMTLNETAFGNEIPDFGFDENKYANVTLFENQTLFGKTRIYCINGKRINPQNSKYEFAVSSKNFINGDDNGDAKYYICNISGGIKNDNTIQKMPWGVNDGLSMLVIGIALNPIGDNNDAKSNDDEPCDGTQFAANCRVRGLMIGKICSAYCSFSTIDDPNDNSKWIKDFKKRRNRLNSMIMLRMILDVKQRKMKFYLISQSGETKLIHNISIPKKDGQKWYPYLYANCQSKQNSSIFVQTVNTYPFWPN